MINIGELKLVKILNWSENKLINYKNRIKENYLRNSKRLSKI